MSYSIKLKGLRPVQNSRRTQANAQISVFKLRLPFSYSKGIYLNVPALAALVSLVLSSLLETPRSISFTF
jgi:hypothetical protein